MSTRRSSPQHSRGPSGRNSSHHVAKQNGRPNRTAIFVYMYKVRPVLPPIMDCKHFPVSIPATANTPFFLHLSCILPDTPCTDAITATYNHSLRQRLRTKTTTAGKAYIWFLLRLKPRSRLRSHPRHAPLRPRQGPAHKIKKHGTNSVPCQYPPVRISYSLFRIMLRSCRRGCSPAVRRANRASSERTPSSSEVRT